jgi:hypothetical protein
MQVVEWRCLEATARASSEVMSIQTLNLAFTRGGASTGATIFTTSNTSRWHNTRKDRTNEGRGQVSHSENKIKFREQDQIQAWFSVDWS